MGRKYTDWTIEESEKLEIKSYLENSSMLEFWQYLLSLIDDIDQTASPENELPHLLRCKDLIEQYVKIYSPRSS